ncbi:MAG: DegT/DnrJ/EryC1/StrS family aminotransferase, partial [Nanoarchaeota archaeon]
GVEQLRQVEYFTRRRREIAALYTQNLQNVSGILSLTEEASYARHVYHLYVIRVPANQRNRIMEELKKESIFCGIHYPIACHQQKALLNLFPEQPSLPITEKIIHEILTLPIYPLLKDEEVLMICEKLKKALNEFV